MSQQIGKTKMSPTTVQQVTRAKLKRTNQDTEIITTIFDLGPGLEALFERLKITDPNAWRDVKVIVISNIPPEGNDEAPAYVKLEYSRAADTWTDDPTQVVNQSSASAGGGAGTESVKSIKERK